MGRNKLDFSKRVEIRLSAKSLEKLDEQKKKLGIQSRNDYIRMLIELDIMTNISEFILKENLKEKK